MYLFDVNIWIHAHREDSKRHPEIAEFVHATLKKPVRLAYSPLVLSGFLRVTTHPKVFRTPTPFETAMEFVDSITNHPYAEAVLPGTAHWSIFTHLCYATKPKGNLFPDAYLAALAIETGCTWVTCDGDYTRFPGLKLKVL